MKSNNSVAPPTPNNASRVYEGAANDDSASIAYANKGSAP